MSALTRPFFKAPRYLFRKKNILRMLEPLEINNFLDVGCGAGELACTLAQAGMKGVAVDFSEEAIIVANNIRKARGIKTNKLQFKLGGLENTKGQTFDLVSCYEVLEHIEKDEKLLSELTKKSSKYVIISVPAKQKLFDASDEAVGHFRRYEKQDLLAMLERQQLDIIEFINYGYPFTDIVRVCRKFVFWIKLKKNHNDSMKDRSKESGINPVKFPSFVTKIDMEMLIWPLYQFSRLFNRFNLSEGYLVLCRKKD